MKKKVLFVMIFILMVLSFVIIPNTSKAAESEVLLVLDPGHGGRDPGARNTRLGINEADVTLKIARYLRDYLSEYAGIRVIMTHDGLPSDETMALDTRGMVARDNNADMLISLHINSSSVDSVFGAEVYVTDNTSLPKYNEESTKLASNILGELSKLGIYSRGVKTRLSDEPGDRYMYSDGSIADYYGMIRYPMKGEGDGIGVDIANGEGIPGIIVEHCFINSGDIKYINSNENIKKLAKADCDGIVKYYGLKKKSEVIEEPIEVEEPINVEQKNEEPKEEEPKIKVKVNEEKLLIMVTPNVTASMIAEELKISEYIVKDTTDTEIENNALVGTGYKFVMLSETDTNDATADVPDETNANDIADTQNNTKTDDSVNNTEVSTDIAETAGSKSTSNNKTYTIIKLGDANGDGESDAIDLLLIKRSLLGTYKLNDNNTVSLDLNKDGSVDAIDLLLQKRHLLKTFVINI